jgi:hypothetical protein
MLDAELEIGSVFEFEFFPVLDVSRQTRTISNFVYVVTSQFITEQREPCTLQASVPSIRQFHWTPCAKERFDSRQKTPIKNRRSIDILYLLYKIDVAIIIKSSMTDSIANGRFT